MKTFRFGFTPLWLLLLAGLSVYGRLHHPWISYRECVKDPARCRGRVIEAFREPQIGEITADGFVLLQRGEKPVFVHADTTGLKTGEYTGLKASLLEDGTLKAEIAVTAHRRREKMFFSLIPAVIVLFLFGTRFRFDFQKWTFHRRTHA